MKIGSQFQKKAYYQNAFIKSLLVSSLLIAILATSKVWYDWLIRNNPSRIFLALTGLMICIIGSVIIFTSLMTHIEISQEGITFYSVGFRIYTPWHNIVNINKIKHPYFSPLYLIDAFVLEEPARLNISIKEGKQQGIAVVEKHWILLGAKPSSYLWYMPMPSSIVKRTEWEQGEIGTFIRLYAPHIFERR
ncbi:MAG TPA: hypothetical protein VKY19_21780 [Ktedonosporobacter sp.]|jgi:hypothetical protein|nr:hypothetical protein [Ktedonosporobacter sp.]